MTGDHTQLAQQLAALQDNIATARIALTEGNYRTIQHLQFYDPFRWCLNTHPTFARDRDVHTVIGHTHRLHTEYVPQENDEAIERCLEDFEQILSDLQRWNSPLLPTGECRD